MAKKSQNLVHVGTHVPLTVKMTLIALAESQDKSVYELLQAKCTEMAQEYEAEVEELKKRHPHAEQPIKESNDDLLG